MNRTRDWRRDQVARRARRWRAVVARRYWPWTWRDKDEAQAEVDRAAQRLAKGGRRWGKGQGVWRRCGCPQCEGSRMRWRAIDKDAGRAYTVCYRGARMGCPQATQEQTMSTIRTVNPDLVGVNGNAFSIMGAFRRRARAEGWTDEEIKAVCDEAMDGDYDHLLATIARHCDTTDDEDEG